MLRRTRRTLWILAAVLLLLAAAIYLRFKAPPEAARLLPESEGIVYLNLRPLRTVILQDLAHQNMQPITRAPDYQAFIDATGIDWERDLDEAAVALHRMDDPRGPNGPVAYSMVLVGKLDGKALARYLEAHAKSKETYEGHTIFSLPSEGRTVRIAQIAYDMVAISNTPTPEQIHSMLERHRTAALPFAGSALLAQYYSEMPLLSVAWGMGQIGLPFSEDGKLHVFGMGVPLPQDTTFLASVSALKLRVIEIAPNENTAQSQAASLNLLLNLARGATAGLANNTANTGLRELLRTTAITQRRERVIVTASLPQELLGQLIDASSASSPSN
jgi:hypothetical protein